MSRKIRRLFDIAQWNEGFPPADHVVNVAAEACDRNEICLCELWLIRILNLT